MSRADARAAANPRTAQRFAELHAGHLRRQQLSAALAMPGADQAALVLQAFDEMVAAGGDTLAAFARSIGKAIAL